MGHISLFLLKFAEFVYKGICLIIYYFLLFDVRSLRRFIMPVCRDYQYEHLVLMYLVYEAMFACYTSRPRFVRTIFKLLYLPCSGTRMFLQFRQQASNYLKAWGRFLRRSLRSACASSDKRTTYILYPGIAPLFRSVAFPHRIRQQLVRWTVLTSHEIPLPSF